MLKCKMHSLLPYGQILQDLSHHKKQSTDAVTDFVEAIGLWVDELQVNRVRNAPFFSLMADECVDVANIEELSV